MVYPICTIWIKLVITYVISEPIMGLDSHVYTSFVAEHCFIINGYKHPVRFSGYKPKYGTKSCLIVTGNIEYDYSYTGQSYM